MAHHSWGDSRAFLRVFVARSRCESCFSAIQHYSLMRPRDWGVAPPAARPGSASPAGRSSGARRADRRGRAARLDVDNAAARSGRGCAAGRVLSGRMWMNRVERGGDLRTVAERARRVPLSPRRKSISENALCNADISVKITSLGVPGRDASLASIQALAPFGGAPGRLPCIQRSRS